MLHTMCALQHVTCLFHKVMTMMYSTPFFKHHVPCPLHLLHCTFYYVLWAMAWPQGPDLVGPNNNSKLGYELHWPQGPYLVGPTYFSVFTAAMRMVVLSSPLTPRTHINLHACAAHPFSHAMCNGALLCIHGGHAYGLLSSPLTPRTHSNSHACAAHPFSHAMRNGTLLCSHGGYAYGLLSSPLKQQVRI